MKKIRYFDIVRILLVVSLFTLGMPLDGQFGQFSAGSMVVDGLAALHVENVKSVDKTNAMLLWATLYAFAALLLLRRKENIYKAIQASKTYSIYLGFTLISVLWSSSVKTGLFEFMQLFGSFLIGIVIALYFSKDWFNLVRLIALSLGAAQLLSFLIVVFMPDVGIAPNGRWVGVYGAPNYLGSLAFCSVWASFSFLMMKNESKDRLYTLFVVVSFANLIGTNSITSILSLALALSCIIFWKYLFNFTNKGYEFRAILGISALAVVLFLMFGGTGFLSSSIIEASGRSSNLSGRSDIWNEAIHAISQNLILGVGYGEKLQLLTLTRLSDLHSYYLTVLYNTGLVGLALFGLFIIQVLKSSVRLMNEQDNFLRYSVPLVLSLLLYNITETALFVARSPIYILFVIITASILLRNYQNVNR